ncbi:heptaprenyl diphosphate synthase component II [Bacillus sp. PS06]|uniref:heptaprenyl diphosphate synthase component II n=1 Tax=Bacillus sp. PS06 TaxID=2764176 RepID=UPI00177B935A|nr:heptaprenyl diphosphate synthase component II [Bacillus sp. PS06]MBD8070254.1 heptaprenyl diphosphate synthase component II [Bacillus sp. PS06]
MKLKMMYSFLSTDLAIIEKELEETVQAEHPLLRQAGVELLQAGGKRLRPVFVLLAGKFGDYDIDKIKNVAVALEIIHMASLVHDDVIDDAELRRGRQTIKSKYDNKVAMYTGDFLFARALELMTKLQDAKAHKLLSHTMVELCIGEIEQIKDKYDFDQNLRTYLRRIKRKTALLIAVSCQLGAIAANVSEDIQKKLYLFGYYVGMSFQITDDILDFTATEEQLGKPAGSDLLQGNITLPVLIAIRDSQLREQIVGVSSHSSVTDIKPIIELVKSSNAIDKSFELSNLYLQKAFDILDDVPNNKTKTAFHNIARFIGKRKF